MKKKKFVTYIIVLLLFSSMLSARSLLDLGLQVVTLYDVDAGIEHSGFFEGMSEGANWNFGFGVEARLSILHTSVVASLLNEDENIMNLQYSLLLDIPIVNDMVYLSIGGGLTTQLDLPQQEGTIRFNDLEGDVTFSEVLLDSPIHLKASVDFLLGPAIISLFYVRETSGRIGEPIDQIFTSSGVNKSGIALTLSLF